MVGEVFMAFNRTAIYADYFGAGFGEIIKAIPKLAGFFGANHAFILGVKVNHQEILSDIIGTLKACSVLVGKHKCGHFIADCQFLLFGLGVRFSKCCNRKNSS